MEDLLSILPSHVQPRLAVCRRSTSGQRVAVEPGRRVRMNKVATVSWGSVAILIGLLVVTWIIVS
jgi:hypothetical protein